MNDQPVKLCTFPDCGRPLSCVGLCATHYLQQRRGKGLAPIRRAHGTIPLADRFWSRVERGTTCWEWRGEFRPQGYGVMSIKNRNVYAHRIAWELEHGAPVPDGMVIDHVCLNRKCVRPAHLRATTQKRNSEYRPRGNTPVPVSGIRGVYPARGKWAARLMHNGVLYNLGNFADKEQAGRVVAAKRNELFQFPEYQGAIK